MSDTASTAEMTLDKAKELISEWASSVDFDRCVGAEESAVLYRERDEVLAFIDSLVGGIENYLLWEPGRAGHAEAHRKLAALVASDGTPSAAQTLEDPTPTKGTERS